MCDDETLKHFADIDNKLKKLRSVQTSISEDVNATANGLGNKIDKLVDDISNVKIEQAKPLLTTRAWIMIFGAVFSAVAAISVPAYKTMFLAEQLHDAFSKHIEKDMGDHKINAENIHALDNRIIVLEQK